MEPTRRICEATEPPSLEGGNRPFAGGSPGGGSPGGGSPGGGSPGGTILDGGMPGGGMVIGRLASPTRNIAFRKAGDSGALGTFTGRSGGVCGRVLFGARCLFQSGSADGLD